ncbi:hypothetical protein Droror1_Dr00016505, partial [Drosera rotundifolia]
MEEAERRWRELPERETMSDDSGGGESWREEKEEFGGGRRGAVAGVRGVGSRSRWPNFAEEFNGCRVVVWLDFKDEMLGCGPFVGRGFVLLWRCGGWPTMVLMMGIWVFLLGLVFEVVSGLADGGEA